MRNWKLVLVFAAGTLFALRGGAEAFHDGGVAHCDGCHTMHNSLLGAEMVANAPLGLASLGNPYLLLGQDASTTCLNCHGNGGTTSYHLYTPGATPGGVTPATRTPGGDFAWLGMTFNYIVRGNPLTSDGERHGHNIIADGFGLVADSTLLTAPGGTYNNTSLSCISCHDPHGKYRVRSDETLDNGVQLGSVGEPTAESGSYGADPTLTPGTAVGVYRLLGGVDYRPLSLNGVEAPFTADPPIAVAPATYNQTEATNQVRVAYGSGMSEWCANCHTTIHTGTNLHPSGATNGAMDVVADVPGNTISDYYNAYVGTANLSGVQATSYNSLVPYEEGIGGFGAGNYAAAITTLDGHSDNTGVQTAGPVGAGGTEQVMCLSCHRAHASGWDHMARWNMAHEFILEGPAAGGWLGVDGRTAGEVTAAMYDNPTTNFSDFQRSLCNKCHVKD